MKGSAASVVTGRRVWVVALVMGLLALMGSTFAPWAAGTPKDPLQAAKVASARYHSVGQAEADGYVLRSACVSSPGGAMGIHFENAALMADPALDPARPEILLYLPGPDGQLELVGLEFWKADADQNPATDPDRPSIFGAPFNGPMPGHHPAMPVHYDLHVWVWETNPNGTFSQFNPALSCPA